MKIGISCHALKYSGGIERYAMDLVRGLAHDGVRPDFFAKAFDRAIPEFGQVIPHRIEVRWLPGKLRDHFFAYALKRLRRQVGVDVLIGCNRVANADIAICGGTHLGFMSAAGKAANFWERKQTDLERTHYAHARLIVSHSQRVAEEMVDLYGVARDKIRVIYPPIDAAKFRPLPPEERQRLRDSLGFPRDRVVYLFPSSSHKRKGYDLLSAYFEQTQLPVTLLVTGRPIPRKVRNVEYIGYNKNIEQLYQAADFTVLASRYEAFGLVGPESVLCGTPALLASNVGSAETIQDHGKLLFECDDLASFGKAVEESVAWVKAGRARIDDPHGALRYDPGIDVHIREILQAWEALNP